MTERTERDTDRAARPAVDVYTTPDAVEIRVDMPGVTRDGLRITLEASELLVEGDVTVEGGEPVGETHLPTRYRRLFAISDVVERDRVRATLRDGVLEMTLPKSERVKPRRIPIEE